MNWVCSGNVAFHILSEGVVDSVMALPGIEREAITRIELPLCVSCHRTQLLYRLFPNLVEIIAHPHSPTYLTHDGALYNRRGALILVPPGKRSLRLAPFIRSIDYRAFNCNEKLTDIAIDPGNEYFSMRRGCLTSGDGREIYFVSNRERTLYISKDTEWLSRDVLDQPLRSVVVEPENDRFCFQNNILCGGGRMLLLCDRAHICIPPAVTRIIAREAHELLAGAETIRVSDNHPVFRADGNALMNAVSRRIIYLGANAEQLTVPDGYTLSEGCLVDALGLKRISVPYDLRVSNRGLWGKEWQRESRRAPLSVTVRWPDGGTVTAEGSLSGIMRVIQSQRTDVKRGTEGLYLDLYLAGRICEPAQRMCFASSVFQILVSLIDQNDLPRMEKVIADNRLITRKSASRLTGYARQFGRPEMLDRLRALNFDSLPAHIAWDD